MKKDKDLSTNWDKLESEILIKASLFNIRKDRMYNKSEEIAFDITVMESGDAVNVIPVTKEDEIVFAEQFRFGTEEITIELPGGMMDPGEDFIQTAQRELLEETGYVGTDFSYLGKTASHPVFMNSYIHHILALDVELKADTRFDAGEMVNVILIPKSKVKEMMKSGAFNHPHAIAALVRYLD